MPHLFELEGLGICCTHRRTDFWPTPTWWATAADAAVNDGYSDWCSRTNRTARSQRAESIFFGMTHVLSTQIDAAKNLRRFGIEVSTKQGHGQGCVTRKITGWYYADHEQYFFKPTLDTLSVPLLVGTTAKLSGAVPVPARVTRPCSLPSATPARNTSLSTRHYPRRAAASTFPANPPMIAEMHDGRSGVIACRSRRESCPRHP